jgi:hypothetical protein
VAGLCDSLAGQPRHSPKKSYRLILAQFSTTHIINQTTITPHKRHRTIEPHNLKMANMDSPTAVPQPGLIDQPIRHVEVEDGNMAA